MDERIAALQAKMEANQIDCFLIPSQDSHQSEYVAAHWESRAWISGFTGSAGISIVTRDHAGLWTDSRYFLQAGEELAGSKTVLHKYLDPGKPAHFDWLEEHLPNGSTLAFDARCFSVNKVKRFKKRFKDKDFTYRMDLDPVEGIWEDRPDLPAKTVHPFPLERSGESFTSKLGRLREKMDKEQGDYFLLTTLADIAWLFNLRGADVDFNPVFYAWALIGKENAQLFLCNSDIETQRANEYAVNQVEIHAYDDFEAQVAALPGEAKILYHGDSLNQRLFSLLPEGAAKKDVGNPVAEMKTIKNETEVKGIRSAMKKDGVALLRLYRWLEANLDSSPSEYEIGEKLAELRSQQEGYFGESFPAIAGYKGNGAIVHYRPKAESSARLQAEGVFLLDSGGQYQDGTTDITRTTALGEVNPAAKEAYTYVLQGHIALARVIFPKGTHGAQLDLLARQFLWQAGLNFGHGTGHGVGHFLNVHEGPQRIAPGRSKGALKAFQAGMFTSNEPGFYKAEAFGIRIENLILCVPHEKNEYGDFLKFETLTLFPIDTQLLLRERLSPEEISWLNGYHEQVYRELSPLLEEEEKTWLQEKCAKI